MKKLIGACFCMFITQIAIAQFIYRNHSHSNSIYINGIVNGASSGDTVELVLMPFGIDYKFLNKTYFAITRGSKFSFKIKGVMLPGYINMTFKKKPDQDWGSFFQSNLHNYLIEPGDSIIIVRSGQKINFSGRGSVKYEFQKKLDSIDIANASYYHTDPTPEIVSYYSLVDSLTRIKLKMLELYKSKLNKLETDLLYISIVAGGSYRKQAGSAIIEVFYKSEIAGYLKQYHNILIREENNLIKYPGETDVLSNIYPAFLLAHFNMDYFNNNHKNPELQDYYMYIKFNYHGLIREKLMTYLLLDNKNNNLNLDTCLNDALRFVKYGYFKKILNEVALSRLSGSPSIDFNLIDSANTGHTLKQYYGKVIVLDFWFTGCSNCIKLTPFMNAIETNLSKDSVIFITISVDKNKRLWMNSIRSGLYTSANTIDLFEDTVHSNGQSVFNKYNIDRYPTIVVIDRYGKIMRPVDDPRGDNGKDLIKLIKKGLE